MKRLEKVIDRISFISMWIANIMLAAMTALIVVEIIARSFFNTSTLIADEYGRYLLVGVVFMGLLHTFRQGSFIRVDFFYNKFLTKPIVRKIVNVFGLLLAAAYLFIIIIGSAQMTWSSYDLHSVSVNISETPLWIPQIVIPIGLSLLFLQIFLELVKQLLPMRAENMEGGGTQ